MQHTSVVTPLQYEFEGSNFLESNKSMLNLTDLSMGKTETSPAFSRLQTQWKRRNEGMEKPNLVKWFSTQSHLSERRSGVWTLPRPYFIICKGVRTFVLYMTVCVGACARVSTSKMLENLKRFQKCNIWIQLMTEPSSSLQFLNVKALSLRFRHASHRSEQPVSEMISIEWPLSNYLPRRSPKICATTFSEMKYEHVFKWTPLQIAWFGSDSSDSKQLHWRDKKCST